MGFNLLTQIRTKPGGVPTVDRPTVAALCTCRHVMSTDMRKYIV